MTNPSLKNTRWIIKVAFPKLPASNFREVVCKKKSTIKHGATADHSQKHRHFAIFLVSKPQDHSGNNQNSLESHRIIKWFLKRLSTLILSQVMASAFQFSGFRPCSASNSKGTVSKPATSSRNQRHNDNTNGHSTAPVVPVVLAFLPSTWQVGKWLLVPMKCHERGLM